LVVQVHPGRSLSVGYRVLSQKPQPTIQPTTSLHQLRSHSQRRQIFPLRRPCFIAIVLGVQIERRLNLRVTQDALHGLRFDFRLAPASCLSCDAGCEVRTSGRRRWVLRSSCCRPQMIGDEDRGGEGNTAAGFHGGKHEVSTIRVGALRPP
jgi:hypothetical protein